MSLCSYLINVYVFYQSIKLGVIFFSFIFIWNIVFIFIILTDSYGLGFVLCVLCGLKYYIVDIIVIVVIIFVFYMK